MDLICLAMYGWTRLQWTRDHTLLPDETCANTHRIESTWRGLGNTNNQNAYYKIKLI